jgi:hypothetical protein
LVKSRGGSRYFSKVEFYIIKFGFHGGGESTIGFQTGGGGFNTGERGNPLLKSPWSIYNSMK